MRDIVDLERYPLDRLDTSAGRTLVDACRAQLEREDCCLLPGFLVDAALAAARSDALAAAPCAHQVDHEFAYDDVDDDKLHEPLDGLPPNHPRRFRSLTRIRFVARDLIPAGDPLRRLHAWERMTDFIGRVMETDPIYPSACPLSSCVFTIAERGELQDWHFDGNEFIVTLMLEAPGAGGQFEYVSGLRDRRGGDDYERIAAVLNGAAADVRRPALEPGTLTLFRGKYNLHRAAPVGARGRRVMAILSYEDRPGVTGTDDYLKLFYGRRK